MKIKSLPVDQIIVGHRLRSLDVQKVRDLEESIKPLGLKTPITVRVSDGRATLVAGLHRLEAARALGWQTIACVVEEGSETDSKLWEIAENLHRADLTVLERSE